MNIHSRTNSKPTTCKLNDLLGLAFAFTVDRKRHFALKFGIVFAFTPIDIRPASGALQIDWTQMDKLGNAIRLAFLHQSIDNWNNVTHKQKKDHTISVLSLHCLLAWQKRKVLNFVQIKHLKEELKTLHIRLTMLHPWRTLSNASIPMNELTFSESKLLLSENKWIRAKDWNNTCNADFNGFLRFPDVDGFTAVVVRCRQSKQEMLTNQRVAAENCNTFHRANWKQAWLVEFNAPTKW